MSTTTLCAVAGPSELLWNHLAVMAALVKDSVGRAVALLQQRDDQQVALLFRSATLWRRQELDFEEAAQRCLARLGLADEELAPALCALRIEADLGRLHRDAVGIAERMLLHGPMRDLPLDGLGPAAQEVLHVVDRTLNALKGGDRQAAAGVLEGPSRLPIFRRYLLDALLGKAVGQCPPNAVFLLDAAVGLDRLAERATAIAEGLAARGPAGIFNKD